MKKHTRSWLENLATTKNNSRAKEILSYIEKLEAIQVHFEREYCGYCDNEGVLVNDMRQDVCPHCEGRGYNLKALR